MPTLEFYYDFSCPYAYLASTGVEALSARHDAELVWKPILLGGLLAAHQSPPFPAAAMPPSKARHSALDILRWAELHGVPLRIPAAHPMRTVDALRLVLVAPDDARPALDHALYRAYWVENRRLDDRAVLTDIADDLGLDGPDLVSRSGDAAVKQALRDRTDEAVRRGVFGVPTFFVGDLMFWGQDRLHFVERALAGEPVPGLEDLPRWGMVASRPG